METIGIRELRQHASTYVAAAAAGQHLVVTDRGTPVAMLVPLSPVELNLHRALSRHQLLGPVRARRSFTADQRPAGSSLSDLVAAGRAEGEEVEEGDEGDEGHRPETAMA